MTRESSRQREVCGCREGRTLDKLLMDYILFDDPTAAAEIAAHNPTRRDNA